MSMLSHDYPLLAQLHTAVLDAHLTGIAQGTREPVVGAALFGSVRGQLGSIPKMEGAGIEGSGRRPDFAFALTGQGGRRLRIAVELKRYLDRSQGAGELDRGVGQSLAYAAEYDAVVIVAVFMYPHEDPPLPPYWNNLEQPIVLEWAGRRVPLFFLSRPL